MDLTMTVTTERGRIDRVITDHFADVTRSQADKWLHLGLVTVNGKTVKASYKVAEDDQLLIAAPEPTVLSARPQDIPLDIVYEDDDVLVVNKPQGMVVHPAPGHPDGTLVNGLMYHTTLSPINGVLRPGIVHRIDKDTSGLLMVAKTALAHQGLAAQLKDKTTTREYLAIVHGNIKEDTGTIDAPLGRDPKDRKKHAVVAGGRHAVTHFAVVERFGTYTLVRCRLETGRTHQIRVHMAYIKHPVAGDPLYGPKHTLPGNGQYLHAATLGFTHPVTGKRLEFAAPLPDYFEAMLVRLRRGDFN
ncbi:RluA family pseudouridine synthase [Lacticaseibacillus pantheris]|uniref:Pseudouridine synthase n=1 Tax=Lacticaseibacillus pantheris DSM 15945 = JCM 12539 = NBRC 106106 TaxID=1423783 RepID=A0A0R1TVU3_9LACO|nr:RluA family pseudouridine synthase [Lacticaseibacillus pantheris]KRL85456.1 23S RNA-specific pseudouridylate synthase [Lacticaseibacillus pantheris DSM 15945 = JCM 12539 = NBRC 106106]WKF84389.1 RluA family pseudouridine synthase [Lacticaseibacillus pantheris]